MMKYALKILRFFLTPARITAIAASLAALLLPWLNQIGAAPLDPTILQGTIEALIGVALTLAGLSGAAEAKKAIKKRKDSQ